MFFKAAARSRGRRVTAPALLWGIVVASILLLSGCSDLFSVQPLATAETTVFEPRLLGEWSSTSSGGSDADGRNLNGLVLFRAGEAGKKEYDITWIPNQGEALRLRGQLVKVGDRLILDLLAMKESNWGIPGHFFMLMENRIRSAEPNMRA